MTRRFAALALGALILLSGCAPTYATPDERSEARGDAIAEALAQLEPHPEEFRVDGSYDGVGIIADLGDLSFDETREFLEGALTAVDESPLGSLPVTFDLSHSAEATPSQHLKWWGYDPARSERYFAAVEVWLSVLADPGVRFEDEFSVAAPYVFGMVLVLDDRDIVAYREGLADILEEGGYFEPGIYVRPEDA